MTNPYKRTIALTGNSGSGKTFALSVFKSLGAETLIADSINHELLKEEFVIEKLRAELGDSIIDLKDEDIETKDGDSLVKSKILVNIPHLRKLLLQDSKARAVIESILHPLIRSRSEFLFAQINKANPQSIVIYEIPLLYEKYSGNGPFPLSILISSPTEVLRDRILFRDKLSSEEIEKRLSLQMPQEDKMKFADFIISNDGNKEKFKNLIVKLWFEKILPYFHINQ